MTTALLIVDVQRALFESVPAPFDAQAVVQRLQTLSMQARAAGVPVVWVRHGNASNLVHGAPGWQLVPALGAQPEDLYVDKTTPDAFAHTSLQALLQERQVQQLVVGGYASEFCVDTTVRRAAGLGYAVALLADAHTTHDKPHASGAWIRQHHSASLSAMRSFGRPITALDSAAVVWPAAMAGHGAVP